MRAQHCAFLVSEADLDAALARVRRAGIPFFAEFDGFVPGEINHLYGDRGFYFRDPNSLYSSSSRALMGRRPNAGATGRA